MHNPSRKFRNPSSKKAKFSRSLSDSVFANPDFGNLQLDVFQGPVKLGAGGSMAGLIVRELNYTSRGIP